MRVQCAIKLRERIKIRQEITVLRSKFLSGWSQPSIALKLLTSERQPPKAKTPSLSLIFDGSCFGAPSKRTSHGDRKPATRRLLWTHGESRHQDLGAPLPYPWIERAKPLEGRVAAAHLDVVGCGLWVVGCVLRVLVWACKRLYLSIPIL